MKTKTILNGVELENYDKFMEWLDEMQEKFIACKDYKGYPRLPDNFSKGMELYRKASKDEQELIATHAIGELIECFRYWKVDRDKLYGAGEWKKFIY